MKGIISTIIVHYKLVFYLLNIFAIYFGTIYLCEQSSVSKHKLPEFLIVCKVINSLQNKSEEKVSYK